jgi:hypothetical protein
VLGEDTLWHLQKFLQYIIVEFTPPLFSFIPLPIFQIRVSFVCRAGLDYSAPICADGIAEGYEALLSLQFSLSVKNICLELYQLKFDVIFLMRYKNILIYYRY